MKKVCIVTGTRAEYGLLKSVIDKVYKSDVLKLQLVVTGMHLSTEFGLTYKEIEEDGYPITSKVEMLLDSDTPRGITKSMGIALIGFADCFDMNKPDIIIILGDRYEMLAVASAAMIARIPIAHIHGGELTEGAIDDAIRHSITKMSQLHFTSTEKYRKRIIQLGEQPQTVYNVGALGLENVKKIELIEKRELEVMLDFQFGDKTIIVTYHPVTIEKMTSEKQFKNLLEVINRHDDLTVIFTKSNADMEGRMINKMIDDYVSLNSDRCYKYASLGQQKYLSVLKYCDAVVGNSSSGIIEAPSFHIPTVNIGDRQKGRERAKSVIDCGYDVSEIEEALMKALSFDFKKQIEEIQNPYEGKSPSHKIVNKIKEATDKGIDIRKTFYDIEH